MRSLRKLKRTNKLNVTVVQYYTCLICIVHNGEKIAFTRSLLRPTSVKCLENTIEYHLSVYV